MPEGSVWYNWGVLSLSTPAMSVEIPNGRLPPVCVYLQGGKAVWQRPKVVSGQEKNIRNGAGKYVAVGELHKQAPACATQHQPSSPLLQLAHVASDIVYGRLILHSEAMALALNASLVHHHSCISLQPCKGHCNVIIDAYKLSLRAWVLWCALSCGESL